MLMYQDLYICAAVSAGFQYCRVIDSHPSGRACERCRWEVCAPDAHWRLKGPVRRCGTDKENRGDEDNRQCVERERL